MGWWNKRAKERGAQAGVVKLPRLDPSDHGRMNDANCVACYIRNDTDFEMEFVSQLESVHPMLIEAPAWKSWKLAPGAKNLVPHRYWDILPHDRERKITISEIPKDHEPVEFLYKRREITEGSGAAIPHSQSAGFDTQFSGAEPQAKA